MTLTDFDRCLRRQERASSSTICIIVRSSQWRNFNKKLAEDLRGEDQAVLPCIVFFRVHAENIEDVLIYR